MGSTYGNMTAVTNVAYSAGCAARTTCSDKVMQVMWTGAKYAVTKDFDVVGAYYHYIQNDYTSASCANLAAHSQCAGTFDAVSAVVDWRFAPKWDALRHDVLAGECRPVEQLLGAQQLRSHSWCAFQILNYKAYVIARPKRRSRMLLVGYVGVSASAGALVASWRELTNGILLCVSTGWRLTQERLVQTGMQSIAWLGRVAIAAVTMGALGGRFSP